MEERGYFSSAKEFNIIKIEVQPNIFRDVFEVTCKECEKTYKHNIAFVIKCPHCESETNLTKQKDL